jgi:hypothetical protein
MQCAQRLTASDQKEDLLNSYDNINTFIVDTIFASSFLLLAQPLRS